MNEDQLYEYSAYFGKALQFFFTHMHLYHNVNGTIIDLMDYLPYFKKGFCLSRISVKRMIYQYAKYNGPLSRSVHNRVTVGLPINTDGLFLKSFNADIPAEFYYPRPNAKLIKMDYAIEKGKIEIPLNTFQAILKTDPKTISNIELNKIIKVDTYPHFLLEKIYPEIFSYLTSRDIRENLIEEEKLIRELREIYSRLIYPDNFFRLVCEAGATTFILKFLSDERIILTSDNNEDFVALVKKLIIKPSKLIPITEAFLNHPVINPRYDGDKIYNYVVDRIRKLETAIDDHQKIVDERLDEELPKEVAKAITLINKYQSDIRDLKIIKDSLINAMSKRYWHEKEAYSNVLPTKGTVFRDVLRHTRTLYER